MKDADAEWLLDRLSSRRLWNQKNLRTFADVSLCYEECVLAEKVLTSVAARLESLEAENERLREAIEFAVGNMGACYCDICQKLRAALQPTEPT